MTNTNNLEVWLRGPISDVPGELQPVAHALLQAREEVNELTANFPEELLWEHLSTLATVGFHLQHLTGVLDRLFTYARGESLNTIQLQALARESEPNINELSVRTLVHNFNNQVDQAIAQLRITTSSSLTSTRLVGRMKLPSTVLGLLFHAAEHTQRHVGQLLVTIRVLKSLTKQ